VPLALVAAAHDWQLLVQAVSQHRPSTQLALLHSRTRVQVAPFDCWVLHWLVAVSQ
jgi:hypothetical protein